MTDPRSVSMEQLSSGVEEYTIPRRPDAPPSPIPTGHFPTAPVAPRQAARQEPPKVLAKTEAELNPDLIPVVLPSQFFFYSFKDMALSKIRGRHQAKLNAAAAKNSLRSTVEVVSSLSNRSAFGLTIPDFYWCLYWLRINSYMKQQLTHVARCRNKDHLLAVAKGEKEDKTLETIVFISGTSLEERPLDVDKLNAYVIPEELSEIPLYTATIMDMVEVLESEGRPDWEEFTWLAEIASYLGHQDDKGQRLSLEKRVEIAADFSADQIKAVRDYSEIVNDYGVKEKITTQCGDCGAMIESEVSITADTFQ